MCRIGFLLPDRAFGRANQSTWIDSNCKFDKGMSNNLTAVYMHPAVFNTRKAMPQAFYHREYNRVPEYRFETDCHIVDWERINWECNPYLCSRLEVRGLFDEIRHQI